MDADEQKVDRLLQARADIEVELRRFKTSVSVLFTDVVGSTAYFERYGDTAGLALLNRHSRIAGQAASEFQGRVLKTIGDSVMAAFAEAGHAVRAAVEIQRRVFELNRSLPERERLQLRIGINQGTAFLHGRDFFGDVVNVAARITKLAGPAQILISHAVHDAVKGHQEFRCLALGTEALRGKTAKEEVFEVAWTDTGAYADLRRTVTQALERGELIARSEQLDQLLEGETCGALPAAEVVPPASVTPPPVGLAARYQILDELGRGGMGIVYKARDRETGELVALKVLRPDIAADPAIAERFKNELRLARKITQKNVCRIHEFYRLGGTAYISMEYVEGESLRQVLARMGTLSVRKGVSIAQQICAGLQEAHAQGIVHRDLKPENVMLDRSGNVKVMDFGIARSLQPGANSTTLVMGTPAYMAPEQAEGRPLDHRADIYALGLILYEMLTGTPAFQGDTPIAVALKQVREKPTPPRELEPGLPLLLERAILKCLEKDPADRFESVQELDAALAGKPPDRQLKAKPAGAKQKYAKPAVSAKAAEPGELDEPLTPPEELPARPARRRPTPIPLASPAPRRGHVAAFAVIVIVLTISGVLAWRYAPHLKGWRTAFVPRTAPASLKTESASAASPGALQPASAPDAASVPQQASPGPSNPVPASVLKPKESVLPVTAAPVSRVPEKRPGPASLGEIAIVTNVPGARAVLAGPQWESNYVCETPCRVKDAKPGRYTVEVSLTGYRTALGILNVEPGRSEDKKVALEPQAAQLVILSEPLKAEVYFDGLRQTEVTPVTIWTKPGKHTIRVVKAGHVPYEGTKELEDGQMLTLRITLPERP